MLYGKNYMDMIGKKMEISKKDANKLFYAIKGQTIPSDWSESDICRMVDSYTQRLWGNSERMVYAEDRFEKAWKEVCTNVQKRGIM